MDKEKPKNKGFLLRLDASAMELVEKWAAQEFRSVNGQLQWIVADALRRYGRIKDKDNNS
ncbi:MAG: Arc family DNA-binding protein [Muribaculaceae bacterium]|nr:Arc family DNA-binding protein [Muribaculaceae bacterium]MDE6331291.1 Arc family DNA-binding protein [Muribaculaceae bacterium]